MDNSGNLIVIDSGNDRVRLVTADGTIQTIAGGLSFGGDGGQATAALLYHPSGLALTSDGALYIGDWGNRRVRKVRTDGNIATVGSLGLSSPTALTTDPSGNVYILDAALLRRLAPDGTITTIAGGGNDIRDDIPAPNALLNSPQAVAVDANGDLLIAELFPYARIRKVTLATGRIAIIAGKPPSGFGGDGGPAISAQFAFNGGVGLTVDSVGGVYIADSTNNRIRKLGTDGTVSTVAGNGRCCVGGDGGPAVDATLAAPNNVAIDASGNLIIVDRASGRVRMVTPDGTIATIAGGGLQLGDDGPATSSNIRFDCCLYAPGLATAADGSIYVSDAGHRSVRRLTPSQ